MGYRDSSLPPWPKYVLVFGRELIHIVWDYIVHLWPYILPIAAVITLDIYFRSKDRKNKEKPNQALKQTGRANATIERF